MSDSDYRQHMAEYFVQRADGAYTDVSATHVPSNEPTPDEYEPSLVPKGPVADDTHTSAAEEQYEVTTDYSLDGYAPIDSVIQEAPMGHGKTSEQKAALTRTHQFPTSLRTFHDRTLKLAA